MANRVDETLRRRQVKNAFALLLTCVLALVTVSDARARSTFDGTFINPQATFVEYFSLTQTDNQVAGFFYSVAADPRAPDGVKETRINVSGVTDGSRVNFRQRQGTFSTTLGWIARSTGDGFNLSFQSDGGLLGTNHFHAASSDEINGAIITLRNNISHVRAKQAALQQRAQIQAEYDDTLQRLKSIGSDRAALMAAIAAANDGAQKAEEQQAAANDALARAEAAVDKANRHANAAAAVAQTPDDQQHVADLRQVTAEREQDVADARQQISEANVAIQSATIELRKASASLLHFDERVDRMREIVQRDKVILNGR